MPGWLEMAAHLLYQRLLAVQHALVWVSRHTGVPTVLVLAIAIVAAWRLGRRAGRFAFEVGVVVVVLLVLTKIGVLKF
jgi:hypothetical protein